MTSASSSLARRKAAWTTPLTFCLSRRPPGTRRKRWSVVIERRMRSTVGLELVTQPRHDVDDPYTGASLGLADVDPVSANIDMTLVKLAQLADTKAGKSERREDRATGSPSGPIFLTSIEIERRSDWDPGSRDHLLPGQMLLIPQPADLASALQRSWRVPLVVQRSRSLEQA